ncbi:Digeranylgeranylglyceryl phosphate synthase [uncultured archaeon]|nr:Digeranylgeranylglyceryl phosphate synthase [uncultured archaeon]
MQPYISLGRPLTSLMIGLAVFASAFIEAGSGIGSHALPVFLGFSVAFLFGIAGNAINDYFDYENDKVNHPERMLPSGRLKPEQALRFSIFFFSLSFLLALFLSYLIGYAVLLIVVIAMVCQLGYELKWKHEKIIGNVIIGTQTALAFIFGGIIVGNVMATGVIAAAVFLSIVGREIVKDIEDVEGDRGRTTLPMRIGVMNAGIGAAVLIILAVLVSPLPYYPLHIFGWEYLIVVSIADVLFIGSLPMIFKNARKARYLLKFAMLIAIFSFLIGSIFRV